MSAMLAAVNLGGGAIVPRIARTLVLCGDGSRFTAVRGERFTVHDNCSRFTVHGSRLGCSRFIVRGEARFTAHGNGSRFTVHDNSMKHGSRFMRLSYVIQI